MKGKLVGDTVFLGPEGLQLHEQGGYGRVESGRLRLAPEEALYLLHRQKIEIEGHGFDDILQRFSADRRFLRVFLVYRDLRERGFAVQTGPHDLRVFRRGERPGVGESRYLVRVLSERDQLNPVQLEREVAASSRMRKQFILAVVDDEGELTYYEVRVKELDAVGENPEIPGFTCTIAGHMAIVDRPPGALERRWFGTSLDPERLLLSAIEVSYLAGEGVCLPFAAQEGDALQAFLERSSAEDPEFRMKVAVYRDLRKKGYIPKTGYKFGHHFRVYRGESAHSEMLVHCLAEDAEPPMSLIARSVRLAHSVKKKMLFACVHAEGIRYIEFGRIKL